MPVTPTLTGHLNGLLHRGEPVPAHFSLETPTATRRIGALPVRNLGMLLESVRMGNPEGYIKAQKITLQRLGIDTDFVQMVLCTRLNLDLTITNGGGNREMALDVIRLLQELKMKGGEVSTYGTERVISAGAYIWMVGSKRFVLRDSKFLWHTRESLLPGEVTSADKAEDVQIMRVFFEQANEPLRTSFLCAIDQDDKGCHEITTTGYTLVRSGLAREYFKGESR